jgi:long-chain fatty acid transport protein
MNKPFRRTAVASAVSAIALALSAGHAFGSAFALAEQNVMGLGNAFAGAGATAEDANTVWFNPAGLARLNLPQVEGAVHLIIPSSKFKNGASQAALLQPLGGNGGDAGSAAFVPNLYGSIAVNDALHLGIGVNVPFGLKTEYDDGWIGRYQGLKSEVKTININPAFGWKLTPDFWVGAGANWQHFDATLTNNFNYSAALAQGYAAAAAAGQITPTQATALSGATAGIDSFAKVNGDDAAWGWNVGAMLSFNGDANNDPGAGRLGLTYRSKLKYNVVGTVNFTNPATPILSGPLAPLQPVVTTVSNTINQTRLFNGGVMLDIEMPASASLSYYQKLNRQWDFLADVSWTGWSVIKELRIKRTDGSTLSVLPENFDDTWRFSAGVNYYPDEKWVLRAGVAYDQSPVNNIDRSPRLPDNDRTWLAIGARYTYSSALHFDVGAAYIFVKDPSINSVGGVAGGPPSIAATGLINGEYSSHVVVVSGQFNYRFR